MVHRPIISQETAEALSMRAGPTSTTAQPAPVHSASGPTIRTRARQDELWLALGGSSSFRRRGCEHWERRVAANDVTRHRGAQLQIVRDLARISPVIPSRLARLGGACPG